MKGLNTTMTTASAINTNSNLPSDPAILLSFINTRLRDFYPSLDELCSDMEADREEIEEKLSRIGYVYKEERNQFV